MRSMRSTCGCTCGEVVVASACVTDGDGVDTDDWFDADEIASAMVDVDDVD